MLGRQEPAARREAPELRAPVRPGKLVAAVRAAGRLAPEPSAPGEGSRGPASEALWAAGELAPVGAVSPEMGVSPGWSGSAEAGGVTGEVDLADRAQLADRAARPAALARPEEEAAARGASEAAVVDRAEIARAWCARRIRRAPPAAIS